MNCGKRFLLFSISVLIGSGLLLKGQDSTETTSPTPYELMSSYYQEGFKPFAKKTWYLGAAFSLRHTMQSNTTGLIQDVIDGKTGNYSINLKGGYYTGDYTMIGLSLGYYQSDFTGTVFQDPDTIQSNSITRGYSFTPNLRASIPLTASERLSFFIDIGLQFGMSNTLEQDVKYVDQYTRTYSDQYSLGIGFSPGLTFFAMENFAFEVQLNVFGYKITVTDTDTEGLEPGQEVDQQLNFNISLLTLELGLAYYFGPGK